MILGYTLPDADKLILAGTKIHTLRTDRQNRWQPGRDIHHATGNRTPEYKCFLKNKCKSTQQVLIILLSNMDGKYLSVTIDRRRLTRDEVQTLSKNDGFKNEAEMIAWFFKAEKVDMWAGKVIHWTKFKY